MAEHPLRVGIIGLQPELSWAARAHVPALRALADTFAIAGVANSSAASGEAAAKACGLPRAFADVHALVTSPDVDVVAVTVKVPQHFALVRAALEAGKHVYCEWPLGNGLDEAERLADLARQRGVVAVCGTQARVAPEILYLRELIADGYVGEVLSTRLYGWGRGWGAIVDNLGTSGYLLDAANGATMLSIPIGHTLAALRDVLGDVVELSSVVAQRRSRVKAQDSGEIASLAAPDHVALVGRLANGAPLSLHYCGGLPRVEDGLVWDIHGSDGDVRVTAPTGHAQMVPLSLSGARGEAQRLEPLAVPARYTAGWPEEVIPGNVARMYARLAKDVHDGTRTAPTFDDAVALHRLLAAIEQAAGSGVKVGADAAHRPLPL
jgi:predicted dehydrogenase